MPLRLSPSLISCVLSRRSSELEYIYNGSPGSLAGIRSILESVSVYIGPDIDPAEFETIAFRVAAKNAPVREAYEKLISRYISVASMRASSLRSSLEPRRAEDALGIALRASALAEGFSPLPEPQPLIPEPPAPVDALNIQPVRDETTVAVEALLGLNGRRLYYFFGSALALPYDGIVLDILRREEAAEIIGVVRTVRYEAQAVLDDLERLGIAGMLDDVVGVAEDSAVIGLDDPDYMKRMITGAGAVIAKTPLQIIKLTEIVGEETPVIGLTAPQCRAYNEPLGMRRSGYAVMLSGPGAPRQG